MFRALQKDNAREGAVDLKTEPYEDFTHAQVGILVILYTIQVYHYAYCPRYHAKRSEYSTSKHTLANITTNWDILESTLYVANGTLLEKAMKDSAGEANRRNQDVMKDFKEIKITRIKTLEDNLTLVRP